jgi:hypothetical protein
MSQSVALVQIVNVKKSPLIDRKDVAPEKLMLFSYKNLKIYILMTNK